MSALYSMLVLATGLLAALACVVFLWATVLHRLLLWLRYHFLSLGLRFVADNFPSNTVSAKFAEYIRSSDNLEKQIRLRELMAALDNIAEGAAADQFDREEYLLMIERLMGDFCSRLQSEPVKESVCRLAKVAEIVEAKATLLSV